MKQDEKIEGTRYDQWDIYCIDRRLVNDPQEHALLWNRMMWVLTGDEDYKRSSIALGLQ